MLQSTSSLARTFWRAKWCVALGTILFCVMLMSHILPWAMENLVVPLVVKQLHIPNSNLDIRRIRLCSVDVGKGVLGEGITFSALRIEFSPIELIHGHIQSVTVHNLRVNAEVTQGKLNIPGVHFQNSAKKTSQKIRFPQIDHVDIHGVFTLKFDSNLQKVPFTLLASSTPQSVNATLNLPVSTGCQLHAQANLDNGDLRLRTYLSPTSLRLLSVYLPQKNPLMDGKIALSAQSKNTSSHSEGAAQIHFTDITVPEYAIQQKGNSTLSLSTQKNIDMTMLSFEKPWPIDISLEKISISERNTHISALWKCTLKNIPGFKGPLHADGSISLSFVNNDFSLKFKINKENITFNKISFNLLSTNISAKIKKDFSFSGKIYTKFHADIEDIHGKNIECSLPFSWPPEKNTPQGFLRAKFFYKNIPFGLLKLSLRQKQKHLQFHGPLSFLPLSFHGECTGTLVPENFSASKFSLSFHDQLLNIPASLPEILPALQEIHGRARVYAAAHLDFSQGVLQIPGEIRLRQGHIQSPAANLSMDNLTVSCTFADLLRPHSAPAQALHFDALSLGSITLNKGNILFQVENTRNFLIERCEVLWAGGRVGAHAFRIDPDVSAYQTILYCDRMQLARVLEQLGMQKARGGGSVNGRIPLRYAQGKLFFDHGFLYSTPGEKAPLHIEGTDILTAGVPQNSPQYAQLDLAAEALKDYTYDWARISFNTAEEELVVALELDGRPDKPLPFIFDKKIGGFSRVHASSPGSSFQGVRLDVNFRLPMNEILQYRQLIELFKNGG